MYTTGKPTGKGYLKSLYEKAAAVVRRRYPGSRRAPANRKADAVYRYQRPLKLKRILRTVNLCLAATACAASIGWFTFMLLAKSDIFQVASVDVYGNRMVTESAILEKAALTRGVNMLDIDVGEVAGNISSLPWIAGVEIRRSWPSTVVIDVREHNPLALINLRGDSGGAQLFYIDAGGYVFAPAQGGADLDFPVLTGHDLAGELQEMHIRKNSLAGEAMQFLQLAAKGNHVLPLQAVSEVRVSREEGLIVYLVDHPFPIYMGGEKIRERYYLLVRLLTQLYDKDKVGEIKEIRMNYAEDKIMVASNGNS